MQLHQFICFCICFCFIYLFIFSAEYSLKMDVPDSCAIGFRPRRYCLPAVIRSNSVDFKPRPLGMLRQTSSASHATAVQEVMPYARKGPIGPTWSYYYNNTRPDYKLDKTYFGDPRNVYWPTKYAHCAGANTWERTATNSSNCKDFIGQKHLKLPFSYWARYYWNQPELKTVQIKR